MFTNNIIRIFLIAIFLVIPMYVSAVEYNCRVKYKYSFEKVYSSEEIKKGKFSILIEDIEYKAHVSRCSYSMIAGKETCDHYVIDRIEHDKNANIKKYYLFRSQFNVQLFSNLTFIEDNGRGWISYGTCEITSP
jgi:hypothetical protein